MSASFTDLRLSGNYLEIDIDVENVMKVRLDGDMTSSVSDNKIEYMAGSVKLIVDTTPLNRKFEIQSESVTFKVSYCDFPELPEVLAEIMASYMAART
jgi:hypothetical protein